MDMPMAGAKAQTEASFEADKAYGSTAGSAPDWPPGLRRTPNEIIGISTDPKNSQQAVEISAIGNENGDTSKNQISFEEMHLNIGGGNSASGPTEAASGSILEGMSVRQDAKSSPRYGEDRSGDQADSRRDGQGGGAHTLDLFGLMGSSVQAAENKEA